MKMQSDTQLTLKFPAMQGTVRASERAKDSEGRFATEKEDPDLINRLKTENLVMRTNYEIWMRRKDKEIQKLKKEIKELKHDTSY